MKRLLIIGTTAALLGALPAYGAVSRTVVLSGVVSPSHPLSMRTHVRYSKWDVLRVFVYVNGREVGQSDGNRCVAYYYDKGVTVRISDCGTGPLKIKAMSMRPAKIRVRSIKLP